MAHSRGGLRCIGRSSFCYSCTVWVKIDKSVFTESIVKYRYNHAFLRIFQVFQGDGK